MFLFGMRINFRLTSFKKQKTQGVFVVTSILTAKKKLDKGPVPRIELSLAISVKNTG